MACEDVCPEGSQFCTGPCPEGHFCPEGARVPVPCPAGTVRGLPGARAAGDCMPCPAGSFCATEGARQPTGPCAAGFYCPPQANVSSSMPAAFACPTGAACPNGSPLPAPCAAGSYQNRTGQAECEPCPAGFYCLDGAVEPRVCPERNYCPAAVPGPLECPPGSFNTATGAQSCTPCPAGSFCLAGVARPCDAGFFCAGGANSSTASACAAGHYCPRGTAAQLPCPAQTYRSQPQGQSVADCAPCSPGYVCGNATVDPVPCPAGAFCRAGQPPTLCPVGSYRDQPLGQSVSDCLPCPAGFWCRHEGLASFNASACPVHAYCPRATVVPVPCPAGRYSNASQLAAEQDCPPCPGGFFCPRSAELQACPPASFCPPGSATPRPCPSGSFCPGQTARESIDKEKEEEKKVKATRLI